MQIKKHPDPKTMSPASHCDCCDPAGMESHNHNHHHKGGHGEHAGHSTADFKKRFYVSLAATVPILILSPLIQGFLGYHLTFPGVGFFMLTVATFIFFYGGRPFLLGAYQEIKEESIGMMTLIALAIAVAYFYSAAVVFGLSGKIFFWELATLIDIMLLGHWIEMKSVMGASAALEKLSALIPDVAHVKKGSEVVDVMTQELKDGDVIVIKPGEKIPTDGIVVAGESLVNESMLTGEAEPASKTKGQKVIGGSVNEDGSLEVRVSGTGENSYLSKVINLVKTAQASKSQTQNLADRAAFWLTVAAISSGVIIFLGWFLTGHDLSFAIERTATVLVITCPHALGLAIPLVVAVSTALGAQNGLLIKNRTAFENSRKITTVVFDKTGTLTEGKFGIKKIRALDEGYSEEVILRIAGALERNSEHPIAKAVVSEARRRNLEIFSADDFKAIRGKGAEAVVNSQRSIVSNLGYLKELGLSIPGELKRSQGTEVFLAVEDGGYKLIGVLELSDTIRKESYNAVEMLHREGIKTLMLTGDNEASAKSVAEALKLDGYFAGVLPDQKQEKIKELQAKGEFVAMAGDGINDAPALAAANVGIAIGSGTDIAAETADIILVNSNPEDIVSLVIFGKATYKKMVENLVWATGYNVFAIPLAAGVLAGYGILLSPAVGAVLMSLSTIVVAINAKMLKLKK
ncbi:MAG: copper-translocating P-type ATPase [Candidatus Moranbacteria bacterium]|nr:copper-translocating P-type ATPase [Candidatus Moranbacteria bacterium]